MNLENLIRSSKTKFVEYLNPIYCGTDKEVIQEKLKEANLYTDENREKLLSEAEQILLDDAMILPIQHPVSLNIINLNKVKGWYTNPFNIHPLKSVYIQKIPKTYPGLVKKYNRFFNV